MLDRCPNYARTIIFAMGAIAAVIGATVPCVAAEGGERSTFEKIWDSTTLYDNEGGRYIQKFSLSGRLQIDSARFDADEGQYTDAFIWRRFRFGFKSRMFQDWTVRIEGDFDLGEPFGDMYSRLTDAHIGWAPSNSFNLKVLKQSVGFTLDGATSSSKLLTMQRNNLSNNLWFSTEYFTGIGATGDVGRRWNYKAGIFASDSRNELSRFEGGYFTLLSLGYRIAVSPKLKNGLIRVDYVYNDEDADATTPDLSQVVSLVTEWETESWGLRTDFSAGKGYAGQSDLWGAVLMPFYNFTPRIQAVLRYTYVSSADDNGVRLSRYANAIVSGRGNEYNELYAGVNVYFYGQKLKWQTGLEYDAMTDDANDGGEYKGWGLSTGLRLYW